MRNQNATSQLSHRIADVFPIKVLLPRRPFAHSALSIEPASRHRCVCVLDVIVSIALKVPDERPCVVREC